MTTDMLTKEERDAIQRALFEARAMTRMLRTATDTGEPQDENAYLLSGIILEKLDAAIRPLSK